MRGGRKQRQRHYLIGVLLAVLAIAGCAGTPPPADDTLYRQGTESLRRGDFKNAQSIAERGGASWIGQRQSPWYWKYQLLQADALINLGRSQDAATLLGTPPPDQPDLKESVCRSRTVLAKALWRLGRTDEAAKVLDEAESCATSSGLASITPEIHLLKYFVLDTMNRPQEAETSLQLGLKLAQDQKDVYWETVGLNNLGYSRLRRRRFDEAIPILMRAEEGFRKIGAPLLASIAEGNIAVCLNSLGDFDRALETYGRAIEIQEREGVKPYLEASLGEVGNIYFWQDRFTEAIPYYKRALGIALEISAFSNASKWAGNLADAMTGLEEWDQAAAFNEQSRQLKERIKDIDSQAYTRLISAKIAAGQGINENAESIFLEVIQVAGEKASVLWEAHAGIAKLYRTIGKNKESAEHFETAIGIIDTNQAELSVSNYKITFLNRLIKFYQQYVDALVDQKQYDKALQIAESSRARVLMERFGQGRSSQVTSVTARDVAAWQKSRTIALSYWLAPERSFLWVITPQARQLFILPGREVIEPLVQSYISFIHDLRDPLESGQAAGERLYEILLGPARDLIPPGANVVVVPDGALHNLNFEILPVPGNERHYWIEDVVLSVAPSLAVRPDENSAPKPKSLLLIGNPESAGDEYQKLPNAGDEIRSIERRMAPLRTTVFEGAQAKPAVYRASDPEQFSIIHFAAHAYANRESPLESAIILSPAEDSFKLYARDVTELPLQADLVTISACRGAGARVYSGEGLVGFTWAFLQAGARHVIAGLWDVTDRSTAQLMDRLYEGISKGTPAARSLRDAKLALIHSPGNFRKPYYWGPFQIYIGNGRRA